jgi:integrase/recombinase XerD
VDGSDKRDTVLMEDWAEVLSWGRLDQAIAARRPLRDPVQVYLDTLTSAESRATALKRLRAVARIAGVEDYAALPWHQLRERHVSFIKARLIEAGAAPATVNLTLAALRGVARMVRNQGLMSDEGYRHVAEVKPHKGERLPAGRDVRGGAAGAG